MTMNHSAKVNFFFIQNVIYSKVQLKCFRHKSKSGWRHLSLNCGKKENLGKKRIIFHFVEGSARTYNSERRISFPWLKEWRLFRDSRRDVFLIYFSFSAQLTFFSVFSFLFFSFLYFFHSSSGKMSFPLFSHSSWLTFFQSPCLSFCLYFLLFKLGATKHLYNWLCPLVCWSVGLLVRWSVRFFWHF